MWNEKYQSLQYLKTSEVCQLFSISATTVGRYAKEGILPINRLPGDGGNRYKLVDVIALAERMATEPSRGRRGRCLDCPNQ